MTPTVGSPAQGLDSFDEEGQRIGGQEEAQDYLPPPHSERPADNKGMSLRPLLLTKPQEEHNSTLGQLLLQHLR